MLLIKKTRGTGYALYILSCRKMYKKAETGGVGEPLIITTAELPVAPSGQVRLRLSYSGICHSDIHIVEDKFNIAKILGKNEFFRTEVKSAEDSYDCPVSHHTLSRLRVYR